MRRVRKITKKASGGTSGTRFKRVVLHVDPDKTGSTSIQSFCDAHRDQLLRPVELEFNNANGANTIEIIPPNPTSPCTLDSASKDTRKLGVQLVTMKIIEK